jgi:hypothetical protein
MRFLPIMNLQGALLLRGDAIFSLIFSWDEDVYQRIYHLQGQGE